MTKIYCTINQCKLIIKKGLTLPNIAHHYKTFQRTLRLANWSFGAWQGQVLLFCTEKLVI